MATHPSVLARRIPWAEEGAWRAAVRGSQRRAERTDRSATMPVSPDTNEARHGKGQGRAGPILCCSCRSAVGAESLRTGRGLARKEGASGPPGELMSDLKPEA